MHDINTQFKNIENELVALEYNNVCVVKFTTDNGLIPKYVQFAHWFDDVPITLNLYVTDDNKYQIKYKDNILITVDNINDVPKKLNEYEILKTNFKSTNISSSYVITFIKKKGKKKKGKRGKDVKKEV